MSRITKLTIQPLERCSECGNFKDFDRGFVRRVDEEFIVPGRSRTYSVDANRNPYCVQDFQIEWNQRFPNDPIAGDKSPVGLYPAVIVSKAYIGHLLRLTPISEEQEQEEEGRARRQRETEERALVEESASRDGGGPP